MKHIPLPRERCYFPQRNHLLAKKTLSHRTIGSNLLGPDKTTKFPSFPSRSGIKAILPQASGSSHVCATTRRGLDTDCASSAIQQLKECQRTFSPRLYPVMACHWPWSMETDSFIPRPSSMQQVRYSKFNFFKTSYSTNIT